MTILAIPTASIGIYTNGTMFGEYGSILIMAVITALSPVIQTTFRSNNHRQMLKMLVFTEAIALFIVFILSIWMRERSEERRVGKEC